jgi:hypothetical protein
MRRSTLNKINTGSIHRLRKSRGDSIAADADSEMSLVFHGGDYRCARGGL